LVHYQLKQLADVLEGVLAAYEPRRQFLYRIEKAIQIHLSIIVAFTDDVFVDYVIVGLEKAVVGESRELAEPLKLGARDGVAALGAGEVLKDGLSL
jgi:hypothetical protein